MPEIEKVLLDIHALEEDLLEFERKYGLLSETFYAAYTSGEEPEDDSWVLDFSEWASVYRTWLSRLAEYRNEVQRLQGGSPSLKGLIRADRYPTTPVSLSTTRSHVTPRTRPCPASPMARARSRSL